MPACDDHIRTQIGFVLHEPAFRGKASVRHQQHAQPCGLDAADECLVIRLRARDFRWRKEHLQRRIFTERKFIAALEVAAADFCSSEPCVDVAARRRTIAVDRIRNPARVEIIDREHGTADVCGVSVREQDSIEPVHAARTEIGEQCAVVIARTAAVHEPVAAAGADMNRRAVADFE